MMMVALLTQCPIVPAGTIVMFDGPPPPGWQILTDFQDRFPMGTTTFGGATGGTTSHTHTISGTTSSGSTIPNCGGLTYSITPMDPHTHDYWTTTSSADHIPPYRTFIFAKALYNFSYLPQNAVVMSYYPPTRPEWTDITSTMTDRFPRGHNSTPGLTGGTTSHSHTYSGTTTSNTSGTGDVFDYGSTYDTPYNDMHSHTFSGTTDPADHIPPYRTVRFWKATSTPAYIDSCRVLYMYDTLPPCSYITVDPNFNGRFPRANTTTGVNGGSSTHAHFYSFTTSTYCANYVVTQGAVTYHLPRCHNHTASGTTSSADHTPPYRNVIFALHCGPLSYDEGVEVYERVPLDADREYVVYNVYGKEVLRGKGSSLELSKLPKGVYLVVSEWKIRRYIKRR